MPSQSNYQDPQGPPPPPSRNGANTVGAPSTAQERPNVTGPTGPTSPGLPPPRPIPEPTTEAPEPNSPTYSEGANASEPDFPTDQRFSEIVNLQEGVVGVGITGKAVVFSQGTVVDLDQLEGNNLKEGNYDDLLRSKVSNNNADNIIDEFFDTDDTLQYALEQQRKAEKLNKENYNKDEQKRNNNKLLKRLFGARSFLYRTGGNPFVIPFHENPTIEEKRGIVYSEVVVLGGPPLISVKNLNLANIRLTFKLTIPHIAEMLRTEGENELETFLNSKLTQNQLEQKQKDAFFQKTKTLRDNNLTTSRNFLYTLRRDFITKTTLPSELTEFITNSKPRSEYVSFDSKDDTGDSIIVNYRKNYAVYNAQTDYYLKAQSKVYDYLNHIRTLVGDVDSSVVYLNYTPIFNNSRYAVDGYEIREGTNKTYDVTTLMCNNYEIVLNLRQLNVKELKIQNNLTPEEAQTLKKLEERTGNLGAPV